MTKESTYEKCKKSAIEKNIAGERLNKLEKAAIEGKWYFNMVIPHDVIEQIVKKASDAGIKPSELVSLWIMRGLR